LQKLSSVTGIILSGGKSTRMGENKALIRIEGVPIIRRIHLLFQELFEEVIIVTNEKHLFQNLEARIVGDLFPKGGALGGLYTGLFFSSFQYAFCVACDMPYLNGNLIRYLFGKVQDYDVIVPKTKDGLEPLHAYYSWNCMNPIRVGLEQGQYKILDFYPLVKVNVIAQEELHTLDPDGRSFINVNTPEELLRLRKNTTGFYQ
jgi:molybdopterin-guanine dinucleotide biosynthesis protein A